MTSAAFFLLQLGGGFGGFLIPLALMFGIMYFLVILPQQRQRKKVQEMLAAVKNGDKVITTSGIFGTTNGMDGDTVILKFADQMKIRISRAAIAQVEALEDAKYRPGIPNFAPELLIMTSNLKWKALLIVFIVLLCLYAIFGYPTFPTSLAQLKSNF